MSGRRVRSAPARRASCGRHILPNIASPLIVVATTQIAGAIMAEAALSFLGLGMPVTKPSLGTLIRSGYDLMFAGAWWVTVIPGPGADRRSWSRSMCSATPCAMRSIRGARAR